MSLSERRKYPRVAESVRCQLSVGASLYPSETKNLSCGGTLCMLSESVEPMTRLEVRLELPTVAGIASSAGQEIRCSGVVVRQDRVPMAAEPAYLTAIYFSEIRDADRRRIGEFVLRSMFEHDRRRS